MTQPPDKLFHDGLQQYQKTAPSSAWDRIESSLDRKRKRTPWMKIAAGLLILLATSAIVFQLSQPDIPKTTMSSGSTETIVGDTSHTSDVRRETIDVRRETLSSQQSTISNRQLTMGNKESAGNSRQSSIGSQQLAAVGELYDKAEHSRSNHEQSSVSSLQSPLFSLQSTVYSLQSDSLTQVDTANEIAIADAAPAAKGTSISYSAVEVHAKFLKKELRSDATPEKKNTSGFQKVIALAMDLKTEGTVLGDLREKKNDLLSFNASNEKRELNK